jgi:hypothetical protein
MWEAKRHFARFPEARNRLVPQFLGIGGQKCGTTWLDSMLGFHPGLGLPARKEVHYFDGNFWRGRDWYLSRFRGMDDVVRGEITPSYSILTVERIRDVHALNPAMRLVLIIRHPVERAWSHVEMSLIRNRRRKLEEVPDNIMFRQLESEQVLSRSRFSRIITNWRSVFPAEQLLIEVFDGIASEPQALLTRVLKHIGVDPGLMPWNTLPMAQRLNANAGRTIPPRYRERLRELLGDEITALHTLVPRPQVLSWRA